ncbi:MAG TPA: hypothetical protein VL281_04350 [Mycobacteriales bacterium]|jgi:hypothetical protein|nr:hypothetical protein [Mycobacteriales bacterium]
MRAVPVLTAALVLVATPAVATLGDSATASAAFTTTTLAAPTGLTATAGCAGLAAAKVTLGWTATTSAFATGYDVYRAVGGGASTFLASVSPRTTVAYVDTAVSLLTQYTYTVRARFAAWSTASGTASATTGAVCL